MVFVNVHCPGCDGLNVAKHGRLPNGEQRYRCKDSDCDRSTFVLHYQSKGWMFVQSPIGERAVQHFYPETLSPKSDSLLARGQGVSLPRCFFLVARWPNGQMASVKRLFSGELSE